MRAAHIHDGCIYRSSSGWGRYLPPTEWGWETGEHNVIVIVTNHCERYSRYDVR